MMKLQEWFAFLVALVVFGLPVGLLADTPPKIGDRAPDFVLKTLDDQPVRMSVLTSNSPVVLIVVRGWPGYQCPLCTAQIQDYISSARAFAAAKVRMLMVYPGPAPDLKAHAKEFLDSKQWPKDFIYVIDPEFTMVNAYALRWDAPSETAYPSTFLLDRKGTVRVAKICHSHGGRTKASEILAELERMRPE